MQKQTQIQPTSSKPKNFFFPSTQPPNPDRPASVNRSDARACVVARLLWQDLHAARCLTGSRSHWIWTSAEPLSFPQKELGDAYDGGFQSLEVVLAQRPTPPNWQSYPTGTRASLPRGQLYYNACKERMRRTLHRPAHQTIRKSKYDERLGKQQRELGAGQTPHGVPAKEPSHQRLRTWYINTG